jgi:hypothetical protein
VSGRKMRIQKYNFPDTGEQMWTKALHVLVGNKVKLSSCLILHTPWDRSARGTCVKTAAAEEISSLLISWYRIFINRWHQVWHTKKCEFHEHNFCIQFFYYASCSGLLAVIRLFYICCGQCLQILTCVYDAIINLKQ